jgi:site-specific recombinase XerD
MIERYFSAAETLDDLRGPPLGNHAETFCAWLEQQRYPWISVRVKLGQVRALCQWMRAQGHGLRRLDEKLVRRYVASRRRRGRGNRNELHTGLQLIRFLRQGGHIPEQPKVERRDPDAGLLNDFRRFLIEERRITEGAVARYDTHVRALLRDRFNGRASQVERLELRDLIGFLLRANRESPGQTQMIATALRMFGRFLLVRGLVHQNVAAGLPRVTRWRIAGLPQRLDHEEVERLLGVPNRGTPVGRRNRAILLLLARLGLRGCEVCRLELEDIDWREGTIRVRRKGGGEDRLPLPPEVGEALAEHLRGELPRGSSRRVFLTVRAPQRALRGALFSIVQRSLFRAGLGRRPGGPHLLRHSLAAELLHRGASLPEVGLILGHRRAQTTEIYAKVRVDALRELAPAWPERIGVA